MSWYYNYYIGIQDKDTKKIDVFAPFDSLGKLHYIFSKSRSFASDLHEDFYPVNDLLTEDAIRKFWRSDLDLETKIEEDDVAWIKRYTSYLPYNELPSGDYLKKGYFLLDDILAYEEDENDFDGFWEYLTPTAFNFKLQSEMKYGVPTPKKDIEGYEIPVHSCSEYGYYVYPDYQSKEYECHLIIEAVDMVAPWGLPDELNNKEIVIICTQG